MSSGRRGPLQRFDSCVYKAPIRSNVPPQCWDQQPPPTLSERLGVLERWNKFRDMPQKDHAAAVLRSAASGWTQLRPQPPGGQLLGEKPCKSSGLAVLLQPLGDDAPPSGA